MTKEVVIVSGVRTAIGSFLGSLKDVSVPRLGAIAIEEALKRAGIRGEQVDEVIIGNLHQAGQGQNPARQAAVLAGIPYEVPAMTINKMCGSGLKAIHLAHHAIVAGEADIVVAGGVENLSQTPYLLKGAREGFKMGHQEIVDSMFIDGIWCAFNDYPMGITAENLCERYNITREELDTYAARSQERAQAAIKAGRFKDEIIPVPISKRNGDVIIFDTDEFVNPEMTFEELSKLEPLYKEDGSVTSGNSSGLNDGAAALVVMSKDKAEALGLKPLASIVANASVGVDPAIMGIAPVYAVRNVLQRAQMNLDDIDLLEVHETFAAQMLAVDRELKLDHHKLNVNGGAIALGHPFGMSGARIVITLINEMYRRDVKTGLAAICMGSGMGVASLIKRS